ncbi:hypothetical protein ACIF8T_40150 [Streptomyces sp. NPDC085946]
MSTTLANTFMRSCDIGFIKLIDKDPLMAAGFTASGTTSRRRP